MSRTRASEVGLTISIASRLPPISEMMLVILANMPILLAILSRTMMLLLGLEGKEPEADMEPQYAEKSGEEPENLECPGRMLSHPVR